MKAIASKLVKIMGECDYVQKDGTNKFHNYKFASAANVLEKVNAACVKHNVASIPTAKIVSVDEVTTSKGNKERLITVETTLTLVDGDSGESLTTVSLGTGQDPGDKAVAKAQTMAIKYAWMIALNISTGDDPEADESTDEKMHSAQAKAKPTTPAPKKPTQELPTDQVTYINDLLKQKGVTEATHTGMLKRINVTEIKYLTQEQYEKYVAYLEKLHDKEVKESA